MTPRLGRTLCARLRRLAALVVLSAAPLRTQAGDSLPSPSTGFETRILANGLKVWFKRTQGAHDVAVSMAVPYGSDRDPPGKEQLAHFTEHMLFSDRAGRAEEEIKHDLERRGGIENAYTAWDHTWYFAQIERAYGGAHAFAPCARRRLRYCAPSPRRFPGVTHLQSDALAG